MDWADGAARRVLAELVQVDSINPGGREEDVGNKALELLGEMGCNVPSSDITWIRHSEGRASLVITLPGERDEWVGLAGHIDTVPTGDPEALRWPPLSAHVEGTQMWGRGTVDMKGGVAAMLLLYASYSREGRRPPVGMKLILTSDEESGGIGARALDSAGAFDDLSFLFICEPTSCAPGTSEKGCLWATIDARGVSSHASMPDRGVNALRFGFLACERMGEKVTALAPPHPLLGGGTCTITRASGGEKANVVPESARFVLDIRFPPGISSSEVASALQMTARELVEETNGLHLSVTCENCREAIETDKTSQAVRAAMSACECEGASNEPVGVLFYTDGSIIIPSHPNLPFIVLGPGDPAQCHRTDEHTELPEVLRALRIYRKWMDGADEALGL